MYNYIVNTKTMFGLLVLSVTVAMCSHQEKPQTSSPQPTPIVASPSLPPIVNPTATQLVFRDKTLLLPSCGDDYNGESTWYPVFLDGGNLADVRAKYCKDAVSTKRKDTGVTTIQVASFTTFETAQMFAELIGGNVGQLKTYTKSSIASFEPPSSQNNSNSNAANWGVLHSSDGRINLRAGPGTVNQAIGYGINGDRVQILESNQDSGGYVWYKVWFPKSGAIGWIAGQLLERENSSSSTQPNEFSSPALAETTTIHTGDSCRNFSTQAEAQAALPANPQLDRDKDGVACESLH